MVGKLIWQQLKRLAACDEVLLETKKNIIALQEEHTTRLYALEDLEEELYEKGLLTQREKKNVALQELYAKELGERLSLVNEKMKTVSHKRELEALEHEAADIAKKQEVHDSILLKSWQQRDNALKRQEDQQHSFENQKQAFTEHETVYQEQVSALEKIVQEKEADRKRLLETLDDEWRTRYERIRHTAKDPVVPLLQNSCSSCFYLVASKDLIVLKQRHIISCCNCYRFIYLDDVPQKQEAAV